MNSQYTPTYLRLWNRDFLMLIIAELLLCVSCYMTIPFLPQIMAHDTPPGAHTAYACIAVFVAGMYVSGSLSSWFIQRFRRNKVFMFSAAGYILLQGSLLFLEEEAGNLTQGVYAALLFSAVLISGAAFGLAKRTLSCTLLIDKTESQHRTEANYAAVATARMAVAIGPALFILLAGRMPATGYHAIAMAFIAVSVVSVFALKFPFRAPEEGTRLISTDRFFLTQGWRVYIGICCIAVAFGIVMPRQDNATFYLLLLFGFLCSIILLCNGEVRKNRYTSATGLTVFISAAAVLATAHETTVLTHSAAALAGLGLGTACSCQLFHILELCRHCQRSTAESTYFLACDGGILTGIALSALPCMTGGIAAVITVALGCISAVSCHERKKKE